MKYDVQERKIVDVLKTVSIPNYQRHLVWPKKNKKKFIQALILEYPIGVITAYETESIEEKSLVVIDGLQRLSTITQFFSKPSEILNYKELAEILNIEYKLEFKELTNSQNIFIHKYFEEWYNSIEKINENLDTSEFNFMMDLRDNFNLKFPKVQLLDYSTMILSRFNTIIKSILFMKSDIPIIICKDIDEEELPIIFESMNTGSIKLSKYEIYVSQWQKYGEVIISNYNILEDIKKLKKNRYEEIFDKKIEDLDTEQLYEFNKIYLQDILIYYSNEFYDSLHVKKKKSDELAFEILSLIYTNKVYGINQMIENLYNNKNDEKNADFIIEMLEHVKTILLNDSYIFSNKFLSEEMPKFKKYFKIATIFKLSTIDKAEKKIEFKEIKDEYYEFVNNYVEEFKDKRQTSYLHAEIEAALDKFNNRTEGNKLLKTAKVINITHAGNPHPKDKLRIQIVPDKLRRDRNRGLYHEVFGRYESDSGEELYIKFNFEHAIDSNAKNKSIYVQFTDIENFINSKKDFQIITEGAAEMIMLKKMFEKSYIKY